MDGQKTSYQDPYSCPSAASSPWQPTLLFVYGSLQDPDVIRAVLRLPDSKPTPTLRAAKLKNYRMKMWSIYPTLIPCEGGVVEGKVFLVEEMAHFMLLERYETDAYTWSECEVELLDDGTKESVCRTFVWGSDPNSPDLDEGTFDLELYQKYYKPRMMR